MAISKANILSEVNSRTGRAETSIDSLIKAILLDLTIDFPFLKREVYTSTVAGQASYIIDDFSSDNATEYFRTVLFGKIDDNEPMIEFANFEAYQEAIADETQSNWGEPEYFVVYDGILYLYPTPDAQYTVTLFVTSVINDPDNIVLPDIFEEALIEGCCFKLYESKGQAGNTAAKAHLSLYQDAVRKLKKLYRFPVNQVAYNDI